jgi:ribosomal-protein-alanine N-acetyltransferase
LGKKAFHWPAAFLKATNAIKSTSWSLRPWNTTHIEAIAAIDRQSFEHPWQVDSFRAELSRYDALNCVALDPAGEVIAFACSRLLLDELHILKVAVAVEHRKKGIATELMQRIMATARRRGAGEVLLEVRPSNQAGCSLYRKLAFHCIAVRANYYPDTGEDALVLKKTLKEAP